MFQPWVSCKSIIVDQICLLTVDSDRLGPLSIEQKKRTITKRSKLEKNKEDERKPQELKEEDIKRSENETTKNVATVCCKTASLSVPTIDAKS